MRHFDNNERGLIGRLLEAEGRSRSIYTLLGWKDNCIEARFEINDYSNEGKIIFSEDDLDKASGVSKAIQKYTREKIGWLFENLKSDLLFFEYLEAESFIFLSDYACEEADSKTSPFIFGGINHSDSLREEELYSDLISLVVNNMRKEYVPTTKLRTLKESGFRTDDRIRFEDTLKATWRGIIIAMIIGMAGIVLNIVGLCMNDTKGNVGLIASSNCSNQTISTEVGKLTNIAHSLSNAYNEDIKGIQATISLVQDKHKNIDEVLLKIRHLSEELESMKLSLNNHSKMQQPSKQIVTKKSGKPVN